MGGPFFFFFENPSRRQPQAGVFHARPAGNTEFLSEFGFGLRKRDLDEVALVSCSDRGFAVGSRGAGSRDPAWADVLLPRAPGPSVGCGVQPGLSRLCPS